MEIIAANSRKEDCISIRTEVFVREQGVPPELEVDERDTDASQTEHFLIMDGEKPVGTFRAYFETDDTVHLQRLCVLKEYRGRGFGRAALDFTEGFFRRKGAKKITLGAQCTAIGFYEAAGYKAVSDIFLDAGMPHRTMEKLIG